MPYVGELVLGEGEINVGMGGAVLEMGKSIVGMGKSYSKSVLGIRETVLGMRGGHPLGKYRGTRVGTASCCTAAAGERLYPEGGSDGCV
eukprot:5221526-Ditylum_brightwellii.AAC.1